MPNPKSYSKPRQLTIKERMLVDALPTHDWSVTKAGLAMGYSKTYASTDLVHRAKHDLSLSKAIEVKRQVVQGETAQIQGFEWRKEAINLYRDCVENRDRGNATGVLKQLGQHLGVFEADNTQRGAGSLAELAQALMARRRLVESSAVDTPLIEGETVQSTSDHDKP